MMEEELKDKLKEVLKDKRYLQVLQHLKKANVDYGKSIMLNTKIPIQEVVDILDKLEALGLIERVHGATLKNTEAKFKLSSEVHKHHTYYRLTREGDHLLRNLDEKELIKAYIDLVKNDDLAKDILRLAEDLNADHALTYAKLTHKTLEEVTPKLEELERMGLLEEAKVKIIKFGDRKSKPKKETRTHHKYYGLSRIGELVVREMKRRGIIPK
jgi:predicted transcriptional regulator